MRTPGWFCLALCAFASAVSGESSDEPKVLGGESAQESADGGPSVYADISQSAREDAVSFDGIRGLLGLLLAMQKFEASVGSSKNFTNNSIDKFGLYFGME
ncbi:MAG: hypothetical protein LBQ08_03370, partial [Holosporaceae bacterium]|nr:hypothetical protein [Holosporaceae bacterium]